MDEVINLAQVKSKDWEDTLTRLLLNESSNHIFNNIYMPAAQTESLGSFNTTVDIKLRQWAEKQLPQKCVEVSVEDTVVKSHNRHDKATIIPSS